jgi:nucleoid DNA-binding protein
LTYLEFLRSIQRAKSLTKKDASELVTIVFESLADCASQGKVHVPGFGVFETKEHRARNITGFNGAPLHVPRTTRLKFRASKARKQVVR